MNNHLNSYISTEPDDFQEREREIGVKKQGNGQNSSEDWKFSVPPFLLSPEMERCGARRKEIRFAALWNTTTRKSGKCARKSSSDERFAESHCNYDLGEAVSGNMILRDFFRKNTGNVSIMIRR